MPKPIARWNPARDVWETETTGLFCEHSDVYSATWPTSGMTRGGTAYELPTSAPRTDDSECSSLLQTPSVADSLGGHLTRGGARSDELLLPGQVMSLPTPTSRDWKDGACADADVPTNGLLGRAAVRLLPTPEAKLSDSGPDYARASREGSGGDDLTTTVFRAPLATDGTKGGPNQRGSSGDLMLPSAVQLLPTPAAGNFNDGEDPEQWEARRQRQAARGINGNGMGTPLGVAVQLLPTPAAQAAKHSADDRGPGTLDDCNLWSVVARISED